MSEVLDFFTQVAIKLGKQKQDIETYFQMYLMIFRFF